MLPVSKTESKVTTLNFQKTGMSQPSLTRNKWSRICVQGYFMVKTAKCHRMYTIRVREVVGYRGITHVLQLSTCCRHLPHAHAATDLRAVQASDRRAMENN